MFISLSCTDNQAALQRQLSSMCWLSNQVTPACGSAVSTYGLHHGSSGRESWKMAPRLLTLLLGVMSTHSSLSRTGHRASPNCQWAGKCEKVCEYLVVSKGLQAQWNQELLVRNWSFIGKNDGAHVERWSMMWEKAGETYGGQMA